jgi:hypothetical protein
VRVLSDGKMKDHEVLQKKIYLSIIHHLLSMIYHLFNIIIGAADGDDAKPARGDGEGGGR